MNFLAAATLSKVMLEPTSATSSSSCSSRLFSISSLTHTDFTILWFSMLPTPLSQLFTLFLFIIIINISVNVIINVILLSSLSFLCGLWIVMVVTRNTNSRDPFNKHEEQGGGVCPSVSLCVRQVLNNDWDYV